jgi:YfiH family protein
MNPAWLVPDWPAPPGVRAASTLRRGGESPQPWASFNLGTHVGDDPARVAANRRRLADALNLPSEPAWLEQVHGREVLRLDAAGVPGTRVADAAVTGVPGRVLAVLTADCLPVVFARVDGMRVGVAHAGWRGLAAGVLEATLAQMDAAPGEVVAWIGPGIGAAAYEVGADVRASCLAACGPGAAVFFAAGRPGHWQFDLAGLARHRLEAAGVAGVHGGCWCTHAEPERFFSHRRDGAERPTGRMATLAWIGGSIPA